VLAIWNGASNPFHGGAAKIADDDRTQKNGSCSTAGPNVYLSR